MQPAPILILVKPRRDCLVRLGEQARAIRAHPVDRTSLDGTPMNLRNHLRLMVQQKASDLFLSVGAPPGIKIEGRTQPVGSAVLTAAEIEEIAHGLMHEE